MTVGTFGELPGGEAVDRIQMAGGGLSANILTYGAVLQDLRLEGHKPALVLGYDNLPHYLAHSPYFGATAGRYANRIRDGHLEIDGRAHQLDRNFLGKHCLHGGALGIGKRLWRIEDVGPDRVTLAIHLEDGEMGFPGAMDVRATFRLRADATLEIVYDASAEAPTLCNLAHHSYFNLDGGATILDHRLQIKADHYTPVDDELIPTGEIRTVAETAFDFREARPIGRSGKSEDIDHNFCLSHRRVPSRAVATLSSPVSGISMRIETTEPGLQVYDGTRVASPVPGLAGQPMGPNSGVALEPQIWPDAPHHANFPDAILRPGETYAQTSRFVFEREMP